MNFFPVFWYFLLSSGLYFFITHYEAFFNEVEISKFIENSIFKIFWILPFYIINELIFCLLIRESRKTSENFLPKNFEEQKKTLKETHIIIPTFNVNWEDIRDKIFQLRMLFDDRIWIADNANKLEENSILKEMCENYNIQYRYFNIANKTNAINNVLHMVKKCSPLTKYVILLDDDTNLPSSFFLRNDIFEDPTIAGYCCNIEINKSPTFNFWENWIDFEYKTISFRNHSRNFHTLRFLHGIISVYRLDAAIEIFRWNPCNKYGLPFGEDAFAGIQARTIGYKLAQDSLNTVSTYCPKQLFNFNSATRSGYNATSLFKQRALRWYLSWTRRIFHEFALCLFYDVGTWYGNIIHRLDFVYYMFLLIVSVGWIYYLLYLLVFHQTLLPFLFLHLAFFGMTIGLGYFRCFFMDEKEKSKLEHVTIITFPVFLLTLLYLYAVSFLISIFYYIPFVRIDYKKCIARR